MEREVWDLFGVNFEGHPEMTKILTPDELEGHPLRKDYPLTWEQPVFSWNKNDPPEVIK
jgi:NADH-quinone oxidoreductase subunit C